MPARGLRRAARRRLSFQAFLIALLISGILSGLASWYLQSRQAKDQGFAEDKALKLWSEDYQNALFFHQTLADFILDELLSDERILDCFADLALAEDGEKKEAQARLQAAAQPIYERMKKRGLKQLHFHSTESVSLLRMHKPEKFGDSLKDVRKTVDMANASRQKVSAFEEGRIYNGYRNVHPVEWEGEPIGTVETSFTSDAIIEHMRHSNPEDNYIFALRKKVVDSVVFKEFRSSYEAFELSSEYIVEHNEWVTNNSLVRDFPEGEREAILLQLRQAFENYDHPDPEHLVAASGIDVILHSGRHYYLFHRHVSDIEGRETAILFGFSDAPEIDELIEESNALLAYAWILSGILGLSFGATSFFWRVRNEFSKVSEAQAQAERLRAKEMFDKSESVQWVIDPKTGRFIDVNRAACERYGYSKEEFLNRKITEINVMAPEAMFAEMQAVERGEQKYFNFRHRLASGEICDVEVYATNTVIDGQSLIYSIVHDVTEKKAMEAELQEANADLQRQTDYANELVVIAEEAIRTKSAFLATMSHEIRTPLNAIVGMADLLEKTDLNDSQKDFAQTIVSSSDGLLSLINDILDYSKIEAGKMELEHAPFELSEVVHSALNILSVKAVQKGIALTYTIDAKAPAILLGDSVRIRQVILNLLSNAVKFTDAGEVSLAVSARSGAPGKSQLHFEVSDTGIGMDAAACANLFKPFSQADSSITRKYGGTGLGLAISQRIVEAMDGLIEVKSEPGQGSVFHFEVMFDVLSEAVRVFNQPDIEFIAHRKMCVLESNATDRGLLKTIFEEWGSDVTVSEAFPEAIETVSEASAHDVVFVDQTLIEAAPKDAFRRLQAQGLAQHWVLVCSGGDSGAILADDLRFAATIRKPLKTERLYEICKRLLVSRDADTDEGRSKKGENAEAVRNLKILVADDNLVNQKVLGAMLNGMGHQVDTAGNGQIAFEKVSEASYAIVFMDVQMPVMDGLTATQKIKDSLAVENLPVIVALTANAMEGDRAKCLSAGMDDYLSKPVRPIELKQCIGRHYSSRKPEAKNGATSPPDANLLNFAYLSELTQSLDFESKDLFISELLSEIEAMRATFDQGFRQACADNDIELACDCLRAFEAATASIGFKHLAEHLNTLVARARQSGHSISSQLSVEIHSIFSDSLNALSRWRDEETPKLVD